MARRQVLVIPNRPKVKAMRRATTSLPTLRVVSTLKDKRWPDRRIIIYRRKEERLWLGAPFVAICETKGVDGEWYGPGPVLGMTWSHRDIGDLTLIAVVALERWGAGGVPFSSEER